MTNIIIFDVEGVTIKGSRNATVTKVAWIVFDLETKTIIKEKYHEMQYNLNFFNKDSWLKTYIWLKNNMPLSLVNNKSSNKGDKISFVRKLFEKDYFDYDCQYAYAKGLSNIDLSFCGPLGIKTRELLDDYNVPNFFGLHNPLEEIKYFCSFL